MCEHTVVVPIVAPDWGGLQELACRMGPVLQRYGWRWHVVVPEEAEDACNRLIAAGVHAERASLSRLRRTRRPGPHLKYLTRVLPESRALARTIENAGADIVQVSGPHQLQGVIAARLSAVPLVWQLHSTAAPLWARRAMSRVVVSQSSSIMTSGSAYVREDANLLKRSNDLFTFLPPVDTDAFVPSSENRMEMRRSLGIDDAATVVMSVGSRTPVKRHDLIVKAAAHLSAQGRELQFVIVGGLSPVHESWYQDAVLGPSQRLRDTNASANVHVVEGGTEVSRFLAAADLFILPSDAEGAPLALAEAMSVGVPVVATRVGSVPDMVRSEACGTLIEPGDVLALTGAIAEFCDRTPSDRRHAGAEVRKAAIELFSMGACAQVYIDAYTRATTTSTASRRNK